MNVKDIKTTSSTKKIRIFQQRTD